MNIQQIYRDKSKKNSIKGFTLMELVITLAILGILLSIAIGGISAYMRYADFMRNENYAQTVYYAAQTALTRYKGSGELKTLQKKLTSDNSLKGKTIIASDGSSVEKETTDRLYFLSHSKNGSRDDLLSELIGPYVYEGSIMDAAISIEFDPVEGVVYSACYSDKNDSFTYTSETGKTSIADRSYAVRKELMFGYYGVETIAAQTPDALGRPKLNNVTIDNGEMLTLNWSLDKKYSFLNQILKYTIEIRNKDGMLFSLNVNDNKVADGNAIIKRDKNSPEKNIIYCTIKRDGKADIEKLPFYAYANEEDGSMTLVLDAVDTGALENTEVSNLLKTFSITRLGIGNDDIYAKIVALGEPYKPSAPRQSKKENTLYKTSIENGANNLDISIANARHLYNIRFSEKKNDTIKHHYYQTANISWSGKDGILEHGFVFKNINIQKDEKTVFPAIEFLGLNSVYEGRTSSVLSKIYQISGLNLNETQKNVPLGIFRQSYGTVKNLKLNKFAVQGVDDVGALCGINSGHLENITILNESIVSGEKNVGAIVGRDAEQTLIELDMDKRVYVNLINNGKVMGNYAVGGIVGNFSIGKTEASKADTEDKKTIIQNCNNYGVVQAKEKDSLFIGGIAGINQRGTISKCISSPQNKLEFDENKTLLNLNGIFVGGILGYNNNGMVTDCGTENKNTSGTSPVSYILGNKYVGGIVGYNNGTASQLSPGISRKSNKAYVVGASYVGGIAGVNAQFNIASNTLPDKTSTPKSEYSENVKVENWTNEGVVSAVTAYAGGISGYNTGEIMNCYNRVDTSLSGGKKLMENTYVYGKTGSYIGGIAGYNCGFIKSDNSNSVISVVTGKNYVGGIVGYNETKGTEVNNSGIIRNYKLVGGYITGSSFVGGYAGINTSANISKVDFGLSIVESNPNIVNGNYFVGGVFGGEIIPENSDKIKLNCATDNFLGVVSAEKGAFAGGFVGYIQLCKEEQNIEVFTNILCKASDSEGVETDSIASIVEKIKAASGQIAETGAIIEINSDYKEKRKSNSLKSVDAGMYAGGAVGYSEPKTILNIDNTINRTPIRTSASVETEDNNIRFSYAGGIIGRVSPKVTVQGCENEDSGLVKSNGTYMGGITEVNEGKITNCTASGMTVKKAADEASSKRLGGIAGLNDEKAMINNCVITGQISGDGHVGGIVSHNKGTIQNIGDYKTSEADTAFLNVIGSGNYIGGIAGVNEKSGTILECGIRGNIGNREEGSFVGGIAGSNTGKINTVNSYATVSSKSWAGGIIGMVNSVESLSELMNYGDVYAKTGGAGGIAGKNDTKEDGTRNRSNIISCINYGNIEADSGLSAGIIPENTSNISMCTNLGKIVSQDAEAGGIAALNLEYSTAAIAQSENGASVSGVGYIGGITGVNKSSITNCKNVAENRINNIAGKKNAKGVPNYVGGIAGYNANTIKGAQVSKVQVQSDTVGAYIGGVTGYNAPEAVVDGASENELVIDASLSLIPTSVAGNIGGVAGVNVGTVRSIAFTGTIESAQSGNYGVGGIVGLNGTYENGGEVIDCKFGGSITGRGTKCTPRPNETFEQDMGSTFIGGIAGQNRENSTIRECTLEKLKETTVSLYADNAYLGGITGYNDGTLEDNLNLVADASLNNKEVNILISGGSGNTKVIIGGITALNTRTGRIINCSTGGDWKVYNRGSADYTGGIAGANVSDYDTVNAKNYARVQGEKQVAGIFGAQFNSTSGATIITGCENHGKITGTQYVAGIVGYWQFQGGTVQYCFNTGEISNNYGTNASDSAGLIGYYWPLSYVRLVIDGCGNTGVIHGGAGIFGWTGGNIEVIISDSYNAGKVYAGPGIANESGTMSIYRCVNYGFVSGSGIINGNVNKINKCLNVSYFSGNRPLGSSGSTTNGNYYFGFGSSVVYGQGLNLKDIDYIPRKGMYGLPVNNVDSIYVQKNSKPTNPGTVFDEGKAYSQELLNSISYNAKERKLCFLPKTTFDKQLSLPTNIALNYADGAYQVSWTNNNTKDYVKHYEINVVNSEEQVIKSIHASPALNKVSFSLKGLKDAAKVTFQAKAWEQNPIEMTDSALVSNIGSLADNEALPVPKLHFRLMYTSSDSNNTIKGQFYIENTDEYKRLVGDNWKIVVKVGGSERGEITPDKPFLTVNGVNGDISGQAKPTVAGKYTESLLFTNHSTLFAPADTWRLNSNSIKDIVFQGESLDELNCQFKFKVQLDSGTNSGSMVWHMDLYDKTKNKVLAYTELKTDAKEQEYEQMVFDLSKISENDYLDILSGNDSIILRCYPWEREMAEYHYLNEKGETRNIILDMPPAFFNGAVLSTQVKLPGFAEKPQELSLKPEINMDDGSLIYNISWKDDRAEANQQYQVSVYGLVQDGEGIRESLLTQITQKGKSLSLDGSKWNYTQMRVVIKKDGKVGAMTTTVEKIFDIPTRLDTVDRPAIDLPDKNNLMYILSWNSVEGAERYSIKLKEVKNSSDDNKILAEMKVIVDDLSMGTITELNFDDPKFSIFDGQRKIAISISAIPSESDTAHVASLYSDAINLTLPKRMDSPKLENMSLLYNELAIDGSTENQFEIPINEFLSPGLLLNMTDPGNIKQGNYLINYAICTSAEVDPNGDGADVLLKSTVPLNGTLESSSFLFETDPKYAGRYLKIQVRASSDSEISSIWSEWKTFLLPKGILSPPSFIEEKYTIAEDMKVTPDKINLTDNGKIDAIHSLLTWESIDFALGYQITVKQKDDPARTVDNGIVIDDPELLELIDEAALKPEEEFKNYQIQQMYDPDGKISGITIMTDPLVHDPDNPDSKMELLPEEINPPAQPNGDIIYLYNLYERDIVGKGDSGGLKYVYVVRVKAQLSCTIHEDGTASYQLLLPDCSLGEYGNHEMTESVTAVTVPIDTVYYVTKEQMVWRKSVDGSYVCESENIPIPVE